MVQLQELSPWTDPSGNITHIDNAVERIPESLEAIKTELYGLEKQLEIAQAEVKKTFDKKQELKEKTDRLNGLNVLLNVDKRDNELVDDEPGEVEEATERKDKDLER